MELSLHELSAFLFRWIHLFAGVTWIGLLYYFNFVQTEFFKETDAPAKSSAISKLVPRALWWFRWGAMFTFITGCILLAAKGSGINTYIVVGAILGTFMFLNVWLIIWPNQKIVIASNDQVAGGGEALPDAAGALAKAGLASRTNTLFSLPMLFFMGASAHLAGAGAFPYAPDTGLGVTNMGLFATAAIILALELNALMGKVGLMASVKGVNHCGVALTVVLLAALQCL